MTSVSSPFVTTDTPAQMSKSCPPLSSFNHVSFLCANVEHTKCFYRDVLGFIEVKRPESFDFEGSWCANCISPSCQALAGHLTRMSFLCPCYGRTGRQFSSLKTPSCVHCPQYTRLVVCGPPAVRQSCSPCGPLSKTDVAFGTLLKSVDVFPASATHAFYPSALPTSASLLTPQVTTTWTIDHAHEST